MSYEKQGTAYDPDARGYELQGRKKESGMFKASRRGFQITFDNGWTASVMFGDGNYCENRFKKFMGTDVNGLTESCNAEIAAFHEINGRTEWYGFPRTDASPESTKGWVRPKEVLEFLNMIASKEGN